MEFTKIHGLGNDFIVINNFIHKFDVSSLSKMASILCKRRTSIGADGLIAIGEPKKDGDFEFVFFNSDGSRVEMCGNGVRCAARYAYENNISNNFMIIETLAGNISAWRINNRQYKILMNNVCNVKLNESISIDGANVEYSYVEVGNPGVLHCIINVEKLKEKNKDELLQLAKKIRYNSKFCYGVNASFYDIVDNEINILTYEKGVEDFTLACGTAACGTAYVVSLKKDIIFNEIKVISLGGELIIELERNSSDEIEKIYMIGDTNIIAKGIILDEDFNIREAHIYE